MKVKNAIDLGHSVVELISADVVRIDIREKDVITSVEAAQMNAAIGQLSEGREVNVLILGDDAAQFDRSARDFSASPEGNVYTRADALVVKNLAQRIMANFYIKINKPIKPSKVFNSETDALEWFKKLK